jgi:hypothetical protein
MHGQRGRSSQRTVGIHGWAALPCACPVEHTHPADAAGQAEGGVQRSQAGQQGCAARQHETKGSPTLRAMLTAAASCCPPAAPSCCCCSCCCCWAAASGATNASFTRCLSAATASPRSCLPGMVRYAASSSAPIMARMRSSSPSGGSSSVSVRFGLPADAAQPSTAVHTALMASWPQRTACGQPQTHKMQVQGGIGMRQKRSSMERQRGGKRGARPNREGHSRPGKQQFAAVRGAGAQMEREQAGACVSSADGSSLPTRRVAGRRRCRASLWRGCQRQTTGRAGGGPPSGPTPHGRVQRDEQAGAACRECRWRAQPPFG